jgi:hypothetical protein
MKWLTLVLFWSWMWLYDLLWPVNWVELTCVPLRQSIAEPMSYSSQLITSQSEGGNSKPCGNSRISKWWDSSSWLSE